MTGIDLLRLAEGKIVKHWEAVDQLGMLQQIGIIPALSRCYSKYSDLCSMQAA